MAAMTPTDVTREWVVPRWRALGWFRDSPVSQRLVFAAVALLLLVAVFGPFSLRMTRCSPRASHTSHRTAAFRSAPTTPGGTC